MKCKSEPVKVTNNCAISLSKLTHSFADKKVLAEINLQIGKGEIFGLLGPSGAGKTTMIQIIIGQLKQSEGAVTLLGKDSRGLDSAVYKKIGMVLDNCGLYERLSCDDNLKMFAKIYGLPRKKTDEVLARVGLLEARKTPVMQLSKGMRQRLVLARAVMSGPEVLFLDEPTSGLDPKAAAQIHELIREERERGATVFLTTHNMEEAAKLCNHVALLHEGKIVEYGVPEEVCRRYNHQNKLKVLLKDGETIELSNDRTAADAIGGFLKMERLVTIHSTEPNLETVFMELTGRSFE